MKIIAFAFAGGSKYSYPKFSKNIPHFIVMEYPGRGASINEKLITNIDQLIGNLLPKVIKEIKSGEEYVIYGHSMGALIGYLICHKLQALDMQQPIKLIVSGKKSPSIKREKILSHLPNNEFWEEVIKIGGIPDELKNYSDLIDFYAPILKVDFETIENYNYVERTKLNIPIDVYYGTEEEIAEKEIMEWKNESTEEVTITALEGNHFFIFNNVDFFTNYFNNLTKNLIYKQTNA